VGRGRKRRIYRRVPLTSKWKRIVSFKPDVAWLGPTLPAIPERISRLRSAEYEACEKKPDEIIIRRFLQRRGPCTRATERYKRDKRNRATDSVGFRPVAIGCDRGEEIRFRFRFRNRVAEAAPTRTDMFSRLVTEKSPNSTSTNVTGNSDLQTRLRVTFSVTCTSLSRKKKQNKTISIVDHETISDHTTQNVSRRSVLRFDRRTSNR